MIYLENEQLWPPYHFRATFIGEPLQNIILNANLPHIFAKNSVILSMSHYNNSTHINFWIKSGITS